MSKNTGKEVINKEDKKIKGINSDQIILDDAGRFELLNENFDKIAGGRPRDGICRIQTSSSGCGMNM